jgi:hypothetical protein
MTTYVSSLPPASNDNSLARELSAVKSQVAVVRAFVDEVERTASHVDAQLIAGEQLLEELGRLGCRLLEMAASIAKVEVVQPAV